MLDSAIWSNDHFDRALAAFDEMLGACGLESQRVANVSFDFAPPAERQRLQRCADCLRTLEAIWPGARRSDMISGPDEGAPFSLVLRAG